MITVVGGVYHERCLRPYWDEIYGSGGRAASALARMGQSVALHSYADSSCCESYQSRAVLDEVDFNPTPISMGVRFYYTHGLATPVISGPITPAPSIAITADEVLRFGFLEGDAIVKAASAVYDPQNAQTPQPFQANGSEASRLALVLNRNEAELLTKRSGLSIEEVARTLARDQSAEVVVIKMGPLGALVYDSGDISSVAANQTANVWKIGSGDVFSAHFALHWMSRHLSAHEACLLASRATAFYCQNHGLPSELQLGAFDPRPLSPSTRFLSGRGPRVYLAGPFFSLSQVWLIEQARENLHDMGLRVFSPYHDVGCGSAADVVGLDLKGIEDSDLMFAVGDGLDSGTVFEIGYARARNKPVIVYIENETVEDKKMMDGSGCILCKDYVTAIYKTLWKAVEL